MHFVFVGAAALALLACSDKLPPVPDTGARDQSVEGRRDASPPDSGSDARGDVGGDARGDAAVGAIRELDVLFVIDNSAGMSSAQALVIASFPTLLQQLRDPALGSDGSGKPCAVADHSGCKLPSLRIGVVTSDLGVGPFTVPSCGSSGGGRLQNTPRTAGCPAPSDPWIAYNDGLTNVPSGASDPLARVAESFACIAKVGAVGCGFEQVLEASREALRPGVNAGFLRAGAHLLVIYVGDEDDCSASDPKLFSPTDQTYGMFGSFRCFGPAFTCQEPSAAVGTKTNCVSKTPPLHPISRYESFLKGLKPAGAVHAAAIVGAVSPVRVEIDPNAAFRLVPSCSKPDATSAFPGLRISELVTRLGGSVGSICDASFDSAMTNIARQLRP